MSATSATSYTFFGGGALDPNAGGALYPLDNRWELGSEQDNFFAGAGLTWRFLERITVETTYRFLYTQQVLDYDFVGPGALSAPLADPGSRFPDLETLEHVLQSSLRVSSASTRPCASSTTSSAVRSTISTVLKNVSTVPVTRTTLFTDCSTASPARGSEEIPKMLIPRPEPSWM